MGLPVTGTADQSFRKLLDQAEARLKNVQESTGKFDLLKQELRTAEEKVLQESRRIDRTVADTATWAGAWKVAAARAKLPGTVSAAELDTVESVRNTAMSVQALERDIETTSTAQEAFVQRTHVLCTALTMPALPSEVGERIDLLRRRLQAARDGQQRAAAAVATLNTRDGEYRTAEAKTDRSGT